MSRPSYPFLVAAILSSCMIVIVSSQPPVADPAARVVQRECDSAQVMAGMLRGFAVIAESTDYVPSSRYERDPCDPPISLANLASMASQLSVEGRGRLLNHLAQLEGKANPDFKLPQLRELWNRFRSGAGRRLSYSAKYYPAEVCIVDLLQLAKFTYTPGAAMQVVDNIMLASSWTIDQTRNYIQVCYNRARVLHSPYLFLVGSPPEHGDDGTMSQTKTQCSAALPGDAVQHAWLEAQMETRDVTALGDESDQDSNDPIEDINMMEENADLPALDASGQHDPDQIQLLNLFPLHSGQHGPDQIQLLNLFPLHSGQ